MHAAEQLDLQPKPWRGSLDRRVPGRGAVSSWLDRRRTMFQVVAQQFACLGLPLLVYWALDRAGLDITSVAYLAVVGALAFTALAIWVECLAAYRPQRPPETHRGRYPRATAIIAAYLPNEAATIVETVEAFLAPGLPRRAAGRPRLQHPARLPVEDELRRSPRATRASSRSASTQRSRRRTSTPRWPPPRRVRRHVRRRPPPGAGRVRARLALASNGYDVVQGHCVVRNGDARWSPHGRGRVRGDLRRQPPGRARLHGFGDVRRLQRLLAHRRAARDPHARLDAHRGHRLVDARRRGGRPHRLRPGLISASSAPRRSRRCGTSGMRWAQGWFQVSLRTCGRACAPPSSACARSSASSSCSAGARSTRGSRCRCSRCSRTGWLRGRRTSTGSCRSSSRRRSFTMGAGRCRPGRLSPGGARACAARRWFVALPPRVQFFYTEFKNIVARVAQIKQLTGERQWRVTPRAARPRRRRAPG